MNTWSYHQLWLHRNSVYRCFFCSAWDKRKGMSQEDAKKAYIVTVVGQFKAHAYPDEIEESITKFLPAEGGEAAPAAAAQ